MMAITHMVFATVSTGLIMGTADASLLGLAAIAALLPDVDISTSFTGRIFFPISKYLEAKYAHRGVTHSFAASGVVGVVIFSLCYIFRLDYAIAFALLTGYTAGWFMDVFTVSGCQAFYPSQVWAVCPGNRKLRFVTGSSMEHLLLGFFVLLLFVIINLNAAGGFAVQLNNILATTDSVIDAYNRNGSDHVINVDLNGVFTTNRQPVKGDFRLIDVAPDGIVLRNPTGIYLVSQKPGAQIYPYKVVPSVGDRLTTKIQQLVFDDDDILPALKTLVDGNIGSEIYLTGTLTLDDPESLIIPEEPTKLPVIVRKENSVLLNSAPIQDVGKYLVDESGKGQLTAKIRYTTPKK